MEDLENSYMELFELNPLPMWIYDLKSLKFLDVNVATIDLYGYSKHEFLKLTILDVRPHEDVSLLMEEVTKRENNSFFLSGVFRHKKKNGEFIQMEISAKKILSKGIPAVLVLALDVTLRNRYLSTVKFQSQNIKEMAWLLSHSVRAPLARLMGLINIIEMEMKENPDKGVKTFYDLFKYIHLSTMELDSIIREISKKANSIIPD